VLLVAVIALAACGTEDGGPNGENGENGDGSDDMVGKFPVIEISPAEVCPGGDLGECGHTFDQGTVDVGDDIKLTLTIKNTGERKLWVKGIELENYQAAEGAEETADAFRLELPTDFKTKTNANEKFYVAPLGAGTADMAEEMMARVVFTRPADDLDRTADLVISSDASNQPKLTIRLSTAKGFPKIQVSPMHVTFQQVGMGDEKTEQITILNTGAADLEITGFTLSGSQFFTFIVHGNDYPVSEETADPGITFEDPVVVTPGDITYFKVKFKPENSDPANATLIIYSNDPDEVDWTQIAISGN